MRIDADVLGLPQAEQHLDGVRRRAGDLRPALEDVADEFLAIEASVWRTQGTSIGVRWAPLSQQWAHWKAEHYPGAGILEMTGRLRKAMSERGAPYQRREIGPASALLGTTLGIAGIHNRGGTVTLTKPFRRTVKIPKRQFVKIRATDKRRWAGAIGEHITVGRTRRRRIGL